MRRGRPQEAESLLRRALVLRQQAMKEGNPLLVRSKADLRACLLRLGKTQEAERLLESEKLPKPSHDSIE